jgi:hypothetical protein
MYHLRRVALPMIYEEPSFLVFHTSSEPVTTQDKTFASSGTHCAYHLHGKQPRATRATECTETTQPRHHNIDRSYDELWQIATIALALMLFVKKTLKKKNNYHILDWLGWL